MCKSSYAADVLCDDVRLPCGFGTDELARNSLLDCKRNAVGAPDRQRSSVRASSTT